MPIHLTKDCPRCGKQAELKKNRRRGTTFIGCTGYPECKWTAEHDELVEELAGELYALRERLMKMSAEAGYLPN